MAGQTGRQMMPASNARLSVLLTGLLRSESPALGSANDSIEMMLCNMSI